MRSNKFHDALRRPAFDLADRRGNNPHGTREQAEAEGRRLNGYRYETVSQMERALDPRARRAVGEVNPPPASPSGGGGSGGGNGLLWLLGIGAGIAVLSSLWSSAGAPDDDDDEGAPDDAEPLRENPAPAAAAPSNITVNLTMPHAPSATASAPLLNPAPSEPVHVTVPVMAPVVLPPSELLPAEPAISSAAPLLNPEKKKRRRSKSAG